MPPRRLPAELTSLEWLVVGPRTTQEYSTALRRHAAARLGVRQKRTVH